MNTRQIEAYRYYKKRYPSAVIVFHLTGRYMAIFNDGHTSAFPDTDISMLSAIGEKAEVHIVEYRNAAGEFDFPDIKQIQEDQIKDY